jgi:hypothetical protein
MPSPGGESARSRSRSRSRLWIGLLSSGLILGCSWDGGSQGSRSSVPVQTGKRLYRGDLEGRIGLVFFAADSLMTLAYDVGRCGLYAAWRGPIEGDAHDASGGYAPQGPFYHVQTADTLWRLRRDGKSIGLECRNTSISEDSSGRLALEYALTVPGGASFRVRERASFDDHYGDIALRREFDLQDLPAGDTLRVRLGGKAYAWPELWSQGADGLFEGPAGEETLTFTEAGLGEVKLTFEGSAR